MAHRIRVRWLPRDVVRILDDVATEGRIADDAEVRAGCRTRTG
jgi:hypothetical protein